jgi:multimeric flavodoxin WrbA
MLSAMSGFLGVIGSPRRNGNTHVLVSRVLEGAASAGAETETLFLTDGAIRECDGCHLCWEGKHCPKADDMADVFPRIIAADVIVFGTPVYWYGPTGLMKLFIDRFVFFNSPGHRAWVTGKPAVIVVPYEETDPETVRPVIEFFEKCLAYLGMDLVAKIIAPGVSARGEVRDHEDLLREAFEVGATLAAGLRLR